MTDAQYETQKTRIQKLANKWLSCLGLDSWDINLAYERAGIPASPESADAGWQCNAQATVKWEYLKATLKFNMLVMEETSDDELERIFIHECCHALVAEMREWGPEYHDEAEIAARLKHEERVVCGLTHAFQLTNKSGVKV